MLQINQECTSERYCEGKGQVHMLCLIALGLDEIQGVHHRPNLPEQSK